MRTVGPSKESVKINKMAGSWMSIVECDNNIIDNSMGGDSAPSLGGKKKTFADEIFE